MRYLAGNQDSEHSELAQKYVYAQGAVLDRKMYSYFLLYKNDKVTDALPDGIIVYSDYTKQSILMNVYAPKCLTRGVIKAMFNYPFNELDVTDLYGEIESKNETSMALFHRLNCIQVATIENYFGGHNDKLIYWTNRENVARWIS